MKAVDIKLLQLKSGNKLRPGVVTEKCSHKVLVLSDLEVPRASGSLESGAPSVLSKDEIWLNLLHAGDMQRCIRRPRDADRAIAKALLSSKFGGVPTHAPA